MSDPVRPPLAEMWSQWTTDVGKIEAPLALLQLAVRYLVTLERVLDGLGDGDDAVEAGGAQKADESGAVAGDGDVAAQLAGPSDAAN